MRIAIVALLALAPLTTAGASAQDAVPAVPGQHGQPVATIVAEPVGLLFAACDADGDARTTQAELSACLARGFAAADTGHKGAIGYIDYSDWALKWLGDRNALPSPFSLDSDNDNSITLAELQAHFQTLFTRFDVDKDGAVSHAELLTVRAGAGGEDRPGGRRGRRGGGGGG